MLHYITLLCYHIYTKDFSQGGIVQLFKKCAVSVFFVVFTMTSASAAPKVVATILPIHSLVASVMAGVGEPTLLVPPQVSPHRVVLRPSQVKALTSADVAFWVGKGLEPKIGKILSNSRDRSVPLMHAPGVTKLKGRSGGIWEGEGEDAHGGHGHGHGHGHDHGAETDPHVWLDPANARAMAKVIARKLSKADPANRERYKANGAKLVQQLTALEAQVSQSLKPLRKRPFIVFHDAYQYFERRFKLSAAGSLLVHTGHAPSAKRMFKIRKKILGSNVVCVFREPQFDGKLAESVVRGTPARVATLDPLGSGLKPGTAAYGKLIRNLASAISNCLKGK